METATNFHTSKFQPNLNRTLMGSDQALFHNILLALYLIGPPTAFALRYIQAPYGKHNRTGLGPTMSASLAWFLMESPTLWLTLLLFPCGDHSSDSKSLLLILPFLLHYFHRTCLYPIRLLRNGTGRNTAADFPVVVALLGFGFNVLNSYLQTRSVSQYVDYDGDRWFWWRFFVGGVTFLSGMRVNIWSDSVLVGLKKAGGGYKVPTGGWFELVSCPNYFGEIVEWLGWAVMCGSWAGLGFFLYTCANLVPRARASHTWYLNKFGEDYPRNRKAVIPFLY